MKNLFTTLLVSITSVLFIMGCTDSAVQNNIGGTTADSMSVIRGTVANASAASSLMSLSFSQMSAASTTSTTSQTSVLTTTDSIIDVALISDDGLEIQRKTFRGTNGNGVVEFQFEGDFDNRPLRLRFFADSRSYEVAIGSVPDGEDLVSLPALDFRMYSLATRYLEQARLYDSLKRQDPEYMLEKLEQVRQARVAPLGDSSVDELLENLDRVGVNDQGVLTVYNTDYYPKAHRDPDSERPFEERIFEPLSEGSSAEETDTSIEPSYPQYKKRVNWIRQWAMAAESETVLYECNKLGSAYSTTISTGSLDFVVRFTNVIPSELQSRLETDMKIRLYKDRTLFETYKRDSFSHWNIAGNTLTFSMNIPRSELINSKLTFIVEESFPDLLPGEITDLFTRFDITML
jgi:hypothetical protein